MSADVTEGVAPGVQEPSEVKDAPRENDRPRDSIWCCQTSRWYGQFKRWSLKTSLLPLPSHFIDYLEEDSILLPRPPEWLTEKFPNDPRLQTSDLSDDDWAEEAREEGAEEEAKGHETQYSQHDFAELESKIAEALDQFGTVFVKLNWTSPRDAGWVTGNLKCSSPGEIFTLLKASELIEYDIKR